MNDAAANQLADEITLRVESLLPFLGLDVWEPESTARCEQIVVELEQTDNDKIAAEAALSVMSALWPNASPELIGEADWWRTPLGLLCARALSRDDTESVTHSLAGAMLGVHPKSIGALVARGHLDRHPDGGVLRASVLQRLAR